MSHISRIGVIVPVVLIGVAALVVIVAILLYRKRHRGMY